VPWFLAVQQAFPGFLRYFFVVQHFERFAGSGFNNVQPVWFYVAVLTVATVPWSCWIGVAAAHRRIGPAAPLPLDSLMWIWLAVVTVFFSVPQSKLVGYILPALPPLAVIVGSNAALVVERAPRMLRLWRISVGSAAALCLGIVLAFASSHPKTSRVLAAKWLQDAHGTEQLAVVDEYRYDFAFYAGKSVPIRVVSDWESPDIRLQDNWRRELADAASFAPAMGSDRLIGEGQLRTAICSGQTMWVLGQADASRRLPFLQAASVIATDAGQTLWRVDAGERRLRAELRCAP
jgi:hypothetical protein